jgi:hypothetical protein
MTMHPGEQVSYADLEAIAQVSPQQRRDLLDTARELALKLRGLVFDVLTNVGLLCLAENGKLGHTGKRFERVHRFNGKTARILQSVNHAELTPVEKTRLLGQMAASAVVSLGSSPQGMQQLEAKASQKAITINLEDYQDIFKGL